MIDGHSLLKLAYCTKSVGQPARYCHRLLHIAHHSTPQTSDLFLYLRFRYSDEVNETAAPLVIDRFRIPKTVSRSVYKLAKALARARALGQAIGIVHNNRSLINIILNILIKFLPNQKINKNIINKNTSICVPLTPFGCPFFLFLSVAGVLNGHVVQYARNTESWPRLGLGRRSVLYMFCLPHFTSTTCAASSSIWKIESDTQTPNFWFARFLVRDRFFPLSFPRCSESFGLMNFNEP